MGVVTALLTCMADRSTYVDYVDVHPHAGGTQPIPCLQLRSPLPPPLLWCLSLRTHLPCPALPSPSPPSPPGVAGRQRQDHAAHPGGGGAGARG